MNSTTTERLQHALAALFSAMSDKLGITVKTITEFEEKMKNLDFSVDSALSESGLSEKSKSIVASDISELIKESVNIPEYYTAKTFYQKKSLVAPKRPCNGDCSSLFEASTNFIEVDQIDFSGATNLNKLYYQSNIPNLIDAVTIDMSNCKSAGQMGGPKTVIFKNINKNAHFTNAKRQFRDSCVTTWIENLDLTYVTDIYDGQYGYGTYIEHDFKHLTLVGILPARRFTAHNSADGESIWSWIKAAYDYSEGAVNHDVNGEEFSYSPNSYDELNLGLNDSHKQRVEQYVSENAEAREEISIQSYGSAGEALSKYMEGKGWTY